MLNDAKIHQSARTKSQDFKRDLVFSALAVLVCLGLYFLPTGFEDRLPGDAIQSRGRVLKADNRELKQHGIIRTGAQELVIEVMDGLYKGRKVEAVNNLMGKMELDKVFQVNDDILITINLNGDEITWVNATDHYRINLELYLLALFAGLLVVFAGWTGIKALLSFALTGLVIWKVVLPGFMKGYDPVLLSLAAVAAMTGFIIFLVIGLTRRGLTAFLGAILGLGMTCLLAQLFAPAFHLHGAVKPFSETLLYSGFPHLDLRGIFLAGIFLASSGAVMDLAADIASAMDELAVNAPHIGRGRAIISGFRVGRAVVGTMTTTLLLAYSGGYLTMFMVFIAQGVPMINILSLNYVAAEILHTLVGSFGLVTVAPFTALIGGLLLFGGKTAEDKPEAA